VRSVGGTRVISLGGLTSVSAKAFVLNEVQLATKKRFAVVTDTNATADEWLFDLITWRSMMEDEGLRVDGIASLPAFETDIYSGVSPHAQTQERRALALWKLAGGNADAVFLPIRSLISRTISRAELQKLGTTFKRDQDIPPEELVHTLEASGYVREDPIMNVGQFSVRGGIIDVWSPDAQMPVRIEFFGDTVDSIREFDAETQLSTGQLKETSIAPMREFAATAQDFKDWGFFARDRFGEEHFARSVKDRTDFADEGESFAGWEFLLPVSKPLAGTVFDYLKDFIFVIDEPTLAEMTASKLFDDAAAHYEGLASIGEIGLKPAELLLTADEVRERIGESARIELRALGKTAAVTDDEFALPESGGDSRPLFWFPTADKSVDLELTSRPTRKFRGDIPDFAATIRPAVESGEMLLVMNTSGMAERISDILRDYNIPLAPDAIKVGSLTGGFEMPSLRLFVYSEFDILGEEHKPENALQTKPKIGGGRKSRLGAFISDFRDLKQGDYVVHVDHGIGRFDGLQTISAQGIDREFMLLVYADEAKLFVPVERMDLVSRYSSGEATSPTTDRLGGIGWQKTKAKAKRAMRDMADELLKLYAERKLVQGYAFSPDAPWQHEFEDAFPWDLTVDQAKAIEDVKADMETPRPMDRLIIGDVGYGKTEVAMRAAFKAVMDGKQVAVLTPTTVLAYQHYETFGKRFAAFPAKIDLLSRFRSQKEQKAVAAAAEKGDVDVVIGTHRVLSNDVKMPKLGLVIVDEEQRFGVAHKEKLKQLKKKVDVLTLSATPIPRTLNMSLLGMRDMSVIETPPGPIGDQYTGRAVFGKRYSLCDRARTRPRRPGLLYPQSCRDDRIDRRTGAKDRSQCSCCHRAWPDERKGDGAGDARFHCEQIRRSGRDDDHRERHRHSAANTIIINRADNYGLSQLYQLRGRVGRSNRRAYAYLLIPSELELTPIATTAAFGNSRILRSWSRIQDRRTRP
jgi:transcription-repair coupling factor (superfamily II helicase)